MASYQSLGKELECPICLEYPKDPKVMGSCQHAACLDCLQKLVTAQCSSSFPCPVCQEKCMFPSNGVAGLKDDFRLRALVEKYQMMKSDISLIHCKEECPNPACYSCKNCGKIYLCRDCSRKHSQNPLTAAHELVRICSTHGKRLALYCKKCNTAICRACWNNDHANDKVGHDVVPHQEVADEEAYAVLGALEMLDKIREQKENAIGNIKDIQESIGASIDSDLVELDRRSNSAIEYTHNKHSDLKAENSSINQQIENLTKRKNTVEKEIDQMAKKETSLRQEKEQFLEYLKRYREVRLNEFKEAVKQATVETDEIKAKVDHGQRKATSLKRVLDDQAVPSLVKVKEELNKAITAAQLQVDRVSSFVDAKENMARFVPDNASMEIGHFIRREFTTLTRFADVSYPRHPPCRALFSIIPLVDGRLASLCRFEYHRRINKADTISLHDLASPAVPQMMIDKDIYPAVDMTVTSKGELMVLRRVEPAIRVFDSHNGNFSDINISIDKHKIGGVQSVETDEEGNIFVVNVEDARVDEDIGDIEDDKDDEDDEGNEDDENVEGAVDDKDDEVDEDDQGVKGHKDGYLCVFNPDGFLFKEVKAKFSSRPKMSYCRLTRILYIANDENILRYHWDGTTLKEMSSFEHGVDGFDCTDVCISNDGEVFVSGETKDTAEIRIYQVVVMDQPIKQREDAASRSSDDELYCSDPFLGKEGERIGFKMIRLNFDDNADRSSTWYPAISVFGYTLGLGYDDKLELFKLNP